MEFSPGWSGVGSDLLNPTPHGVAGSAGSAGFWSGSAWVFGRVGRVIVVILVSIYAGDNIIFVC
jgi:hypothetical protein